MLDHICSVHTQTATAPFFIISHHWSRVLCYTNSQTMSQRRLTSLISKPLFLLLSSPNVLTLPFFYMTLISFPPLEFPLPSYLQNGLGISSTTKPGSMPIFLSLPWLSLENSVYISAMKLARWLLGRLLWKLLFCLFLCMCQNIL